MNLKQLSALAGIGLSGCSHDPYAQDAPPMPAYIAGLNRHDQMVATTGYRLGQADTANAVYQAARRSSGRLPDTGETPASASATPEVQTEIVNIPVPEFTDADGTVKRAHLERITVV